MPDRLGRSGTTGELVLDGEQMVRRVHAQVGAPGAAPPKQAVRVLVRAALPRRTRVAVTCLAVVSAREPPLADGQHRLGEPLRSALIESLGVVTACPQR